MVIWQNRYCLVQTNGSDWLRFVKRNNDKRIQIKPLKCDHSWGTISFRSSAGIDQSFIVESSDVPVDREQSKERVDLSTWRILRFFELYIWEMEPWYKWQQQLCRRQILDQRWSTLALNFLVLPLEECSFSTLLMLG